jgi:HAD superfamily hydrolase (TIGR01509 family)
VSKQIKAAVFDVDGMLLDTREFLFQAYEHTLAAHGLPLVPRPVMAKHIGRTLENCYQAFAPGVPYKPLRDSHIEFQETSLHLITGYDGLHTMLGELQAAGIKLGVLTNRRGNLLPTLDHAGITQFFGAIVDADQTAQHKPHPEGLLLALGRLDTAPEHAAMLGDAPVDIQAGKAAGVAITVGITHGFGLRADLEAEKPDFIVDSLVEIPALLLR